MFFGKKVKYERIDYKMIIEDTFCDYLSKRATEGWIFFKVVGERILFEKDEPKDIKYQIEYGTLDYDYEDFLKENEYIWVCQFKRMTIFKNYNVHAPDLHSDDYVRLQAAKHMISKHPLLIFSLLALLCLPMFIFINFLPEVFTSFGAFLKNIGIIPMTLFMICVLCTLVLGTLQSIVTKNIINKVIDGKEVDYKLFDTINKLMSINSSVYVAFYMIAPLWIIYLFINDFSYHFINLSVRVGAALLMFPIGKLLYKYRVEKKLIWIIVMTLGVILVYSAEGIVEPIKKKEEVHIPVVDSYMKVEASYKHEEGLLIDYFAYSYNPDSLWNPIKYELVETCINEFVAKEVMKDDIIVFEKETRASNEYIQNILDETGFYSSGDVESKSYKEAVLTLTQYNHNLVEECYYNEHFFIARKDNKILVSYMQDENNYIDNVIEHYFK